MKVLVTGGFGFVGSHVAETLAREGHEVIAASRQNGLNLLDEAGSVQFFQRARPDVVVHCAAHVGGIAYNEQNPIEIFRDNLQIALSLTAALRASGTTQLVNLMPSCSYPGAKTLYTETEWWDGPVHPSVLTYGLSRKALWGLTWAYAKKAGLQSVHLVLPNMYGPRDTTDPLRSHALMALVVKIAEAKRNGADEVMIWGTGKPVREWLYVEDAAEAVVRTLQQLGRVGELPDGLVNIGVGSGVTVTEMAETIRGALGWQGRLVYDTTRPDGAAIKLMDPARMRAWFHGWSPSTSFEAGVAKTVAWYSTDIRYRPISDIALTAGRASK